MSPAHVAAGRSIKNAVVNEAMRSRGRAKPSEWGTFQLAAYLLRINLLTNRPIV